MQNTSDTYTLLDAGDGRKLEQFGPYLVDRPCAQAVWRPSLPPDRWQQAHATFTREGGNRWEFAPRVPASWQCTIAGLLFRIQPTDFGHLGVFPEHARTWRFLAQSLPPAAGPTRPTLLNLFAYSGGATLAAARAGYDVCHLDASKKMVEWARTNAQLNHLHEAPIRWITDDAQKFLQREARRGRRYDAIVLDPPSFGRGTNQELFKIDTHMLDLLDLCRQLLSATPHLLFLSCHTPGYTPMVLSHLIQQTMPPGKIETGEMTLPAQPGSLDVPSGTFAAWHIT